MPKIDNIRTCGESGAWGVWTCRIPKIDVWGSKGLGGVDVWGSKDQDMPVCPGRWYVGVAALR